MPAPVVGARWPSKPAVREPRPAGHAGRNGRAARAARTGRRLEGAIDQGGEREQEECRE